MNAHYAAAYLLAFARFSLYRAASILIRWAEWRIYDEENFLYWASRSAIRDHSSRRNA
jgi:hypothetical protein